MDRDGDTPWVVLAFVSLGIGFVLGFLVCARISPDPTVSVLIYPADALEAGEPKRMFLSQAVRNAAAGVPVTLVGVEGE